MGITAIQQAIHPQIESLRNDGITFSNMLKVLQESISSISTQFNTLCTSSKSNSKTAYETQINIKNNEYISAIETKRYKPRPLGAFKIYSESSDQSLMLKETDGRNKGKFEAELVVNDFKLDSSLSQALQPYESLWKGKSNINLVDIDDEKLIKTPNKHQDKPLNRAFASGNQDSEIVGKGKLENCDDIKIKDFSDFKELLKDLRLSLHLSELSVLNDQTDNTIKQAETLIYEYTILDKEIYNLTSSNNQSTILNLSPIKRTRNSLNVKKSQSLNFGNRDKSVYMYNLELLRKSSNLQRLEINFRDIQHQPHEIDKFVYNLKKEISSRRNKFEELKEFIV